MEKKSSVFTDAHDAPELPGQRVVGNEDAPQALIVHRTSLNYLVSPALMIISSPGPRPKTSGSNCRDAVTGGVG